MLYFYARKETDEWLALLLNIAVLLGAVQWAWPGCLILVLLGYHRLW